SAAHDALGHVRRFDYDAEGRLREETLKSGAVYAYEYSDDGRCIWLSGDDRYNEKTFLYLDKLSKTRVTNSLGEATMYERFPSGQILSKKNPLCAHTRTEFDEFSRVIVETAPNGAKTVHEFDIRGNRSKTIDPLGREWLFTHNETHQLLTLTNPEGGVWKREYDAKNQIMAVENPVGGRWAFTHDPDGNLVKVT
ncbi:MAG: RHS repeat protein, partial [Desulfobacterales bacterium]|nr:RHS repeat protein [Desulfobacterales bacterium]